MLFNEAIQKFVAWQSFSKRESTKASYRVHLMHLGLYMHNCEVEKITLDDIMGYLQGMRVLGWDQNSYMVKCIAFRKFFEYFNKQGITKLDKDLIPIVERQYHMPKTANLDDYYKLLQAIPFPSNDPRHMRNRTILMLFKDTGMRLGELLSLNVIDVDTKRMQGMIHTEKTKRPHPIRKIFWTEETNNQLRIWLAKRSKVNNLDPEAVFVSVTGIKTGMRLRKNGATEALRRLSNEAKLGYVLNSHQLRHLFGRDLAKNGANNSTISTMLGHSNMQSSYVYTMLDESDMEREYRKLRGKAQ